MSFQGTRLNQFVPGYIAHSDFIPGTRINEVSEPDRVQIVNDELFSSETSNRTEEEAECSTPLLQASTPPDTPHTKCLKT